MSGLAKAFVVLILFLSVFFFATSATLFKTRMDWRAAHTDYKEQTGSKLEKLAATNGELTSQIDESAKTIDRQEASLDQISSELKKLREDLSAERAEVLKANAAQDKANVLSQQLSKTLEEETKRAGELREAVATCKASLDDAISRLEIANRERDTMKLDLVKLQEELHNARVEYQQLAESAENDRMIISSIEATNPGIVLNRNIAPPIDAVISAVDNNEELVVLSAGRDQNVEEGYQFTIARGQSFVGKVEVIRVYPDLAGARIMFTKDGEQIRRGDKAFTAID